MMTWPLFSPPRPAPDTSIASRMYLSPTGVRTTRPPAVVTASARPPFESTLTTTVLAASSPRSRRSRARRPMSRSPSTTSPRSSTATQRSASPSRAKPTSAPAGAHAAPRGRPGAVAPQPALMLTPSGVSNIVSTVAPEAARMPGGDATGRAVGAVERRRAGVSRWAGRGPAGGPGRPRAGRGPRSRGRGPRWPARSARRSARSSASSSSSTASSSLRPRWSSTLRPLSWAGLCDAETITPAANCPEPARKARAGVGRTPAR